MKLSLSFCTNSKTCINPNLNTVYNTKTTEKAETLNSLALKLTVILITKEHTEYIIPTLSSLCFVMRTATSLMKTEALILIYFHSIMSHKTIFLGYSTDIKTCFATKRQSLE